MRFSSAYRKLLLVKCASLLVITKSELLFGVEMSPRRRQDEAALSAFLGYVEVLDLPDVAFRTMLKFAPR